MTDFALTADDRAAIEHRETHATFGPWTERPPFLPLAIATVLSLTGKPPNTIDDLQFMLHAREDIPMLLDEVQRLEDRLTSSKIEESRLSLRYLTAGRELAKEIVAHRGVSWEQAEKLAAQLIEESVARKEGRT